MRKGVCRVCKMQEVQEVRKVQKVQKMSKMRKVCKVCIVPVRLEGRREVWAGRRCTEAVGIGGGCCSCTPSLG